MKKKVILKRIFHRDRWRIALFFDFDEKLKAVVNSINGIAFSSTNKCFYVDDSEENLKLVLKAFKDTADVDISSMAWKEKMIEKTDYQSVESGSGIIPVTSSDQNERDYNDTFQPRTIRTVAGRRNNDKDRSGNHDNRSFDPVEFRISEKEGLLVVK
ncbi:MAG: hypothetical protein NTZ85_02795, partial [Bacteroidia bacterium]|nr:hypothetical protein [Bacteroidia bacterium]